MLSPPATKAYPVLLTSSASKAQRKLDKPLRQRLLAALEALAEAPYQLGEALRQPLEGVFSHHLQYKGVEWRIAYTVEEAPAEILVVQIGSHENFYRQLKQWLFA